ncbi:GntR family transcriptional regulator [Aminiphilus circumscriptus]|uniref:GntR family transcriptional regulator n=1 Tax=Aminiphilus circumscriptus TaxID=290732 RepID=UPI0004785D63|nr:GntR family transcriptional regulator [Aminiphilus circumscriptus]
MAEEFLYLQIYRTIKEKIITLELPPGAAVKEREMAEQLGTSRTPVRDALQRLAWDGWVSTGEGKKYLVKELREKDIYDMYCFRTQMEAMALEKIFEKDSSRLIAGKLDSILSEMIKVEGRLYDFTMKDLEFHKTILDFEQNDYVMKVWMTMVEELIRMTLASQKIAKDYLNPKKEHQDIIDALWKKDKAISIEKLKSHYVRATERIAKTLKEGVFVENIK